MGRDFFRIFRPLNWGKTKSLEEQSKAQLALAQDAASFSRTRPSSSSPRAA